MTDTFPFNDVDEEQSTESADEQIDSQTYTSEQVSEVIRIALQGHAGHGSDSIPFDEIVAIGGDFGLTETDIRDALSKVAGEAEKSRIKNKQRSYAVIGFKLHVLTFLAISAGLAILNVAIDPSVFWALYAFIMWGAVVVLHGLILHFAPDAAVALSYDEDELAEENERLAKI